MLVRTAFFPGPTPPPLAGDKNPRERTAGEQLLAEIEAFVRYNPPMTFTRFGREAMNDKAFVRRLQEGLQPEPPRQERARKFMREYGG